METHDRTLAETLLRQLPKDSDTYRRRLAKQIFEDSIQRFPKGGDCPIEGTAAEAAFLTCGACTESTNQLYARYLLAGLHPRILFFHNWRPTLDWLDMMAGDEMGMDHVWLAVPLLQGGLLQADLANRQFDTHYPVYTEVTPRQYVGMWLSNRVLDKIQKGDLGGALKDNDLALRIAPRSAHAATQRIVLLLQLGETTQAETEWVQLQKQFSGHPNLEHVRYLMAAAAAEDSAAGLMSQIDAFYETMGKINHLSQPQAARMWYIKAREMLNLVRPQLATLKGSGWEEIHRDAQVPPEFKKILSLIRDGFRESLRGDPNYLFAFRDYFKFLNTMQWYAQGAEDFALLHVAYPDHPPMAYAAAYFHLVQWEKLKGQNTEALVTARRLSEQLVTRLEPHNPHSYLLLGHVLAAQGDQDEALPVLRQGWSLWGDRSPPQEYSQTYLMALVSHGAPAEELRGVVERALRGNPGAFVKSVTQAIDENYKIELAGPASPAELTHMAAGSAASLTVLNDALGAFSEALPHVDAMRLLEALLYDLAGDHVAAAAAIAKVHDISRMEVKMKHGYVLRQILPWLQSTEQFEQEVIDRVGQFFARLSPHAEPEVSASYATLDTLSAGRYAGLGQMPKATAAWTGAMAQDSAMAVHVATNLLSGMTQWKTRYHFSTMIDDQKLGYAPEFGQILHRMYTQLAQECRDVPDLCAPHHLQELDKRLAVRPQTPRQAVLQSN